MARASSSAARHPLADYDERYADAYLVDAARPMLLFAENLKTWESGFFRGAVDGGEPKQFAMAPKYFTPPVKAKDADVLLLTG